MTSLVTALYSSQGYQAFNPNNFEELLTVGSSDLKSSGTSTFDPTIVEVNSRGVSSQVTISKLAQILYKGIGGFDAVGHIIGSMGYAGIQAPGETVSLVIGDEGKVVNLGGTITLSVAQLAALSDCVAGSVIGTHANFSSGGSNNTGLTLTNLNHFRANPLTDTVVDTIIGLNVLDQTGVSATVAAFLQLSAGANKFNIYCSGTAANQMNGNLSLARAFYPGNFAAVQTSCSMYAGSGVPSNGNGANGDIFLRSDGGAGTTIYHKRVGAWVGIL